MKNKFFLIVIIILVSASGSLYSELNGQSSADRDTIILAAREIINETTYCGLVTIDSLGQPQIRIIWFGTSRTSRKVREIKNNLKVSVYFANHLAAKGYVNISGSATVIDNRELLIQMKRDYWNGIKGWQDKFVLIKIIPKSIEVINYKHGLNNDPETFKAPTISF